MEKQEALRKYSKYFDQPTAYFLEVDLDESTPHLIRANNQVEALGKALVLISKLHGLNFSFHGQAAGALWTGEQYQIAVESDGGKSNYTPIWISNYEVEIP